MEFVVPHLRLPADHDRVIHEYGPASFQQPGVPQGRLVECDVVDPPHFPGTSRRVLIHVAAGVDPSVPQRCTLFLDAMWNWDPEGSCRAGIVLDNLVHAGEIPPMVGVFVEPGVFPNVDDPDARRNRNLEYDTFSSTNADFLADVVLPLVRDRVALSDDPVDMAIFGGSSGGNGAFTAAWHRPDVFGRVVGMLSSFAQIPGGNPYPDLIASEPPKPMKIFLLAGHRDLQWNEPEMNWFAENLKVAAALAQAGYHFRLVVSDGGHEPATSGVMVPEALRWIWCDDGDRAGSAARI